jgi:hypothetical protein
VTTGTPNCNTLAVIAISAIPPGAVPKIKVAGCKSVAHASANAKPTDKTIMASVPAAAEANQRGAVCTNSR